MPNLDDSRTTLKEIISQTDLYFSLTSFFSVNGLLVVLAVDVSWNCLDSFFSPLSFPIPSLWEWETARCRLKYCLKETIQPKTTNQAKDSCNVNLPIK